jgi:hypothetical protein
LSEERVRGPLAHSLSADKIPDHKEPLLVARKVVRGNKKPMRFASLHHHSTFSYMDGYQLPEAHVRRATELNMSSLAMTEHGNLDSHVKFEEAIEKVGNGVKPIFGCELYMPCPWDPNGQRKMHLTVLAKNAEGYKNLLKIVTLSWRRADDQGPVPPFETGFRYEPTVALPTLVQLRWEPGLLLRWIVTTPLWRRRRFRRFFITCVLVNVVLLRRWSVNGDTTLDFARLSTTELLSGNL